MQFSERIIAADALQAVGDAIDRYGLGPNLLLVCDDATWVAAGQQIHSRLIDRLAVTPHSLKRAPQPLSTHIEPIIDIARAENVQGLIAVGSGTINDVTKYAAHQLGLDYLCVATAASMNGYSSVTASLVVDGHKRSFPAKVPKAIIGDLTVLAAAPKRLAKAGLGDSLCRSTVAADRYLNHLVFDAPFEREVFAKMREHEQWLMSNSPMLRAGEPEYFRYLMHTLLDAGDAMSVAQSSAVASQGEHMIAHTLEMMYGREIRDYYHGEMIAVTTTTMAHLQHKMLLSAPQLRAVPREESYFARVFGKKLAPHLFEIYGKKLLPEAEIDALNARFNECWPVMKAELLELIVPAQGIERAYKDVGLATTPQDLGLQVERYKAAMDYAYLTRDRFTFLDLAAMNARRA